MLEPTIIGTFAALIVPVYAALWKINGAIGRIDAKTTHNEQSLKQLSSAVERLDSRATRVDATEAAEADWKDETATA